MNHTEIIVRPLLTEKGQSGIDKLNEYPFMVHPKANKVQIRQAVEKQFKVKVVSVRTQNRSGKRRRRGTVMGATSGWKRALVRLQKDQKLDFV